MFPNRVELMQCMYTANNKLAVDDYAGQFPLFFRKILGYIGTF